MPCGEVCYWQIKNETKNKMSWNLKTLKSVTAYAAADATAKTAAAYDAVLRQAYDDAYADAYAECAHGQSAADANATAHAAARAAFALADAKIFDTIVDSMDIKDEDMIALREKLNRFMSNEVE